MRIIKFCLVAMALVMSLAAPGFAQETTGNVEGTVSDASGGRVGGATVTIEGGAFNRSVTTDENGFYRVLQVPPGVYTVTTSSGSFRTERREDVQVVLGRTSVADVTLQIGQLAEQVTVTGADTATIDPTGSRIQTNITAREIELLPKGTSFASILTLSPGTRSEPASGGYQIDGSSGAENSFIIDGVEVTNFRTGTLSNASNIPFQFVQEVQVKSSGFEAEYGGATGGVINVVTKGGSNDWHGEFGMQFEPERLWANRRPIQASTTTALRYINAPNDEFNNLFPTATLGGPVIKNKLWFFGSYSPQLYRTERAQTYANGQTRTYVSKIKRDYTFFRLDASPFDSLRLTGTYTYNPIRQRGILDQFTNETAPPGGDLSQRGGRVAAQNFSFQGVWTPTDKWVFSVRGGRNYLNERLQEPSNLETDTTGLFPYGVPSTPRFRCFTASNAALPGVTPGGACAPGFNSSGDITSIAKDISIRRNLDVDATTLVNNLMGRHTFKFGYQFNRLSNDVDSGYFNVGEVRLFFTEAFEGVGRRAGEFGYGYLQRFGTVGFASSNNQGVYVQDSWQPVPSLTLNLGLRLENESVPTFSASGDKIEFGWGDKLAPRLGFAWDVRGDGKMKLFGSYGWFYDRFKYQLPRGSFGGDKFTRQYFPIVNPNYNFYTIEQINSLSFTTRDFRVPSNDPADNRIDPELKAARQSEFTVGLEHALASDFVLSTRYTHKQIDRTIEDVGFFDDGGNENFFIANPGLGVVAEPFASGIPATPKAQRDYDAFEVRANKRFGRSYFLDASYTLSRLYGNYSGLASSDEVGAGGSSTGRTSPNVNRFFDLPFLGFNANGEPDNGRLATDRPHAFKVYGGYTFDWWSNKSHSTKFSGFFQALSGTPRSTRVNFFGANTFLFERGDLGRTEAFTQTDLAVTHAVRFGDEGRYAIAFDANFTNLFNQNNVTGYFQTISPNTLSGPNFGFAAGGVGELATIRAIFNGGLQAQVLNLLQSGAIGRDARFNQPLYFQTPRQVRLGFKFTF